MKTTLNIEHVINALGIPTNRFESWVAQNISRNNSIPVATPMLSTTHFPTNEELIGCLVSQDN